MKRVSLAILLVVSTLQSANAIALYGYTRDSNCAYPGQYPGSIGSDTGYIHVTATVGAGAVNGSYSASCPTVTGSVTFTVTNGVVTSTSPADGNFTGSINRNGLPRTTTVNISGPGTHTAASSTSWEDGGDIYKGNCTATATPVNRPFNVTVVIGVLHTGNVSLCYQMTVGAHDKAHTLSMTYNGAAVGTPQTSTVNSSTSQVKSINSQNTGQDGDTWQFIVDGQVAASGTVTLVNGGTTEAPIWAYSPPCSSASIAGGDYYATPAPTPYSTATPTGGATPSPTPNNGSTPPPTVTTSGGSGPGGTGPGSTNSGHVIVDNPADIYAPIVGALRDLPTPAAAGSPTDVTEQVRNGINEAGNDTANPTINTQFDLGTEPNLTNTMDNATTAFNSVNTKFGTLKTEGMSKLNSIQPLNLPTSGLGTVTSYAVTLPVLGSMNIDLSPYNTTISAFRNLCLFVLLIGAWFATIKIIRSGIA